MKRFVYPPDELFGAFVVSGGVEDQGFVVISYDEAVAGNVPEILGLQEGSMFKGIFGNLSDDQVI
ncbi:hypothetical protein D9M68_882450 [compost metagenome]